MSVAPLFEYRIEMLSASHNRSVFESGVEELDRYLHHQAGQDARRKVDVPFVLVDSSASIAGNYALSAYSVRLAKLPEAIARKLPRYPLLPATLIGRLAVSRTHRGLGLRRVLLMDALERSLRNATQVASVAVVVDALDDAARSFYIHHEFQPIADHPNRLVLGMATIEKALRTDSGRAVS